MNHNAAFWKRMASLDRVPSRVLDALIAEQVMGAQWPVGTSWRVAHGEWQRLDAGGAHDGCRVDIPHYSTDKGAAWSVVDKLMEEAFAVTIYVSHDGIRVSVDDGAGNTHGESVDPRDGNVALAICVAALATVGAA